MYDEDYEYDDYYDNDGEGGDYGDSGATTLDHQVAATSPDPAVTSSGVVATAAVTAHREARTVAINEALDMQAAVVEEVSKLTCLSTSAATLLLSNYLWSKDVAVERYFEDPDGVLQRLSVTPQPASAEATLCFGKPTITTICGICGIEYDAGEVCALSTCLHYFCVYCWQDHIKSRIQENLLGTRCPDQHCCEVVGLRVMAQLFNGDENDASVLKDIYREYLSSYVQACPALYWCPNPRGCTGIIYVELAPLQGQGVICDVCNTAFCLRCSNAPHRPATCDNMRDWRRYCSAEGANIAFILVKTKRCPKCSKDIEKNGGCNHMTCKCGYQFCWVCLGDWASHSGNYYSCKNATATPATTDGDDVRESKRFIYHYERYTLHLDSAKRDAAFIDSVVHNAFFLNDGSTTLSSDSSDPLINGTRGPSSATVAAAAESAFSTPEVFSLIKNTLVTARQVIAHGYVHMFYLNDDTNEAMMMAHRVGKLEEATELLSGEVVRYLRLPRSQWGTMMDDISVVNRWQKVLCDA